MEIYQICPIFCSGLNNKFSVTLTCPGYSDVCVFSTACQCTVTSLLGNRKSFQVHLDCDELSHVSTALKIREVNTARCSFHRFGITAIVQV